jgi:hypothetical protein
MKNELLCGTFPSCDGRPTVIRNSPGRAAPVGQPLDRSLCDGEGFLGRSVADERGGVLPAWLRAPLIVGAAAR